MPKEVKREVTVTYRCDGCGHEDIRTEEEYKETLPDGWGSILWVEGVIPRVRGKAGSYSYAKHSWEAESDKPFRTIMCCNACSKKLYAAFRTKEVTLVQVAPPVLKWRWWSLLWHACLGHELTNSGPEYPSPVCRTCELERLRR